ncbi:MAG: alpha/beta hydrolase family protein, partial [Gammaproteobacteria bacterium]
MPAPTDYNNDKASPMKSCFLMNSRALLLPTLLAALLLAGCATRHTEAPKLTDARGNLEETYYQGEIVAPDGVKFRFTVFQPELRAGKTAPLIIHAHGFALTRMESTVDLYAKVLLAGKTAIEAWNKGYWVISIDQRGHGDTGGKVGLIEEDKEVADVVRLIDWAQANLALTTVDGDPKIGMIGESYGGGVQMLASVVDPRIDAVVPITTWFDLDEALFPQGVPKSEWLWFLGVAGYGFNPWHMDWENVTKPVAKEVLFGNRQPMLHKRLAANSLRQYCEAGQYPHADALLIQGMRDVVFPLNQALDARECFLAGGRDVRLVAVEHGHLQPSAQLSPQLPVWWVDPEVTCNNHGINVQRMILNWFDLKLRDKKFTTNPVPAWCITGDGFVDAGMALPPPVTIELPAAHVGSGAAGLVEWAARPLETAKNWFVRNRLP